MQKTNLVRLFFMHGTTSLISAVMDLQNAHAKAKPRICSTTGAIYSNEHCLLEKERRECIKTVEFGYFVIPVKLPEGRIILHFEQYLTDHHRIWETTEKNLLKNNSQQGK